MTQPTHPDIKKVTTDFLCASDPKWCSDSGDFETVNGAIRQPARIEINGRAMSTRTVSDILSHLQGSCGIKAIGAVFNNGAVVTGLHIRVETLPTPLNAADVANAVAAAWDDNFTFADDNLRR